MDVKVSPPSTATGWRLHAKSGLPKRSGQVCTGVAPAPSWPTLSYPQQYATPVDVSAQVTWPVLEISLNVCPPITGVGTDRDVWLPSPSSPNEFDPQQYGMSFVVIAHVIVLPTVTRLNRIAPPTAFGAL